MSRYSRLLELSSFSDEKLYRLHDKRVFVIGVGGVGQYVATSLVTNGVTQLTIVDFDSAEISNLNRQILLTEKDCGRKKVDVVKRELLRKNKEAMVISLDQKVTDATADILIDGYDAVVDAVDNWESKLIIAKACHKANIPCLHVGVDGNKGQYCLFKDKCLSDIVDSSIINAPKDGVMGPMVGSIASLATIDLIRYLSGEKIETDVLYHYDAISHQFGKVKL